MQHKLLLLLLLLFTRSLQNMFLFDANVNSMIIIFVVGCAIKLLADKLENYWAPVDQCFVSLVLTRNLH